MVGLKKRRKKIKKFNENQCPNCGEVLNKDAVFCYSCNSFLTHDGKELLSPEEVTDEDIQRLLDKSKESKEKSDKTIRGKVSSFLSGLAIVFYFLILLMGLFERLKYVFICMGVGVVLFVLSRIISPPKEKTQLDPKDREKIITKYIAAVECRNVYGDETCFEPDSILPEDLILKACFYSPYYSKYEGNRLIQGIWKGYPFRAGHVKLSTFHSHNGYKNTVKSFDGYCMSIDTDLVFPERISILEKYMGCLRHILGEGREESSLFYDVFNVKSDNKETAEHFLTPELRKEIILVSEKYAGSLSIILSPDGNIFIAADGGEKAFAENIPAEKIRSEYRKELGFPLKVVKCFLDAKTIME